MRSFDKLELQRSIFFVVFMAVLFIVVGRLSIRYFKPYRLDYAAYWQAGRMILNGEDVYSSDQWLANREAWGTAPHSERTFQYPLPFAMIFAPISLFPVVQGYTYWVFLSQSFTFLSLYILLKRHSNLKPFVEIAIIASVFLFRPTYIVTFSGQILSLLLLAVSLSAVFYRNGWWFWGGFVFSLVSLKPTVGLTLLILIGLWLLIQKRWPAIAGLFTGGMCLLLLGMIYDPAWVYRYLSIGGYSVQRYYGIQTTLWSLSGVLFDEPLSGWIGAITAIVIVAAVLFALVKTRSLTDPFAAVSALIPVALLVSPYSWSYDQLMLIVPVGYVAIQLDKLRRKTLLWSFLIAFPLLPLLLTLLAYRLGHDVWNLLVSVCLFGLSAYFYLQTYRAETS